MIIQHNPGFLFFATSVPYFSQMKPHQLGLWHGNVRSNGGSSGGAWVVNFSQDESPEKNIIISVTSHGLRGLGGTDFGPDISDTQYRILFDWVSKGCPR